VEARAHLEEACLGRADRAGRRELARPLAPRLVGALGVARARLEDEATVAPPGELAPARTEARVEHLALPDGVLRARAGHVVERGAVAGDEEGRAGAEV